MKDIRISLFTFLSRIFIGTALVLTVFSFGFNDPNLSLSSNPYVTTLQRPLITLVYFNRPMSASLFVVLLGVLFTCYVLIIRDSERRNISVRSVRNLLLAVSVILVFSYPALTYDLFNYITTAKVLFVHKENPYLVMPVEIPNEPYLSFTRAANKVALYGPVWIGLTGIPHALGNGNIWQTIIAFKVLNAALFAAMCYLIWRITRKTSNVLFFALNPLILIEVLVSGHNDIAMIVLAVAGILAVRSASVSSKITGWIAFAASVLVKGATLPLAPLLFFRSWSLDRIFRTAYWIMFAVFVIFTPLREELYPWYAVWFIPFAALLPREKRNNFLLGFTVALSIGLELRHVPYMAMGYYEGPGPLLRTILTVIPPVIFFAWYGFGRLLRRGTRT